MRLTLLQLTVFGLLLINVFSATFLVVTTTQLSDHTTHTTNVVGTAAICINAPPTLIVPCNTTLSQGSAYSCQLNVSDLNSGSQNFTYSNSWSSTQLFNISPSGYFNFTPTNDDVGNHTVVFTVADSSECGNNQDSEPFSFSVANINDAPVYSSIIPDFEMVVNVTYIPYDLNNYFTDPDNDVLTFTNTIPDSPLEITLIGGSSVQVFTGSCDNETLSNNEFLVQFTATDPSNASASSGLITFTVSCDSAQEEEPQTSSGSGSSGGGSGGGASSICIPEWECLDWMSCLPTGYQWRHCYDIQGCNDPKFLKQECTYVGEAPTCDENWLCEDWGVCYQNGTKYRECNDLAECGTNIFFPPTETYCLYEPTCFDGVKNGAETDVDCGGECGVCPVIETPSFITPESFNTWLFSSILVTLILITGLARLYHEELMKGITKALLYFAHHKQKEVLLKPQDAKILFEKIFAIEKLVDSQKISDVQKYENISLVGRDFFRALGTPEDEFTREELVQLLEAKKISQELHSLLLDYFDKIYSLEESDLSFSKLFFYTLTEELRLLVCATSAYHVFDIERELDTFVISPDESFLDETFIRLIRIYRALQFNQIEFAKKEYSLAVETYENLPKEDQEQMFSEVTHLFSVLKYAVEHAVQE